MDDDEIRVDCLEAASRVWAGRAANAAEVLATAKQFYDWIMTMKEEEDQ